MEDAMVDAVEWLTSRMDEGHVAVVTSAAALSFLSFSLFTNISFTYVF